MPNVEARRRAATRDHEILLDVDDAPLKNLPSKLRDRVFVGDLPPLLIDGEKFDAEVARQRIDLLIAKIPAGRKRTQPR